MVDKSPFIKKMIAVDNWFYLILQGLGTFPGSWVMKRAPYSGEGMYDVYSWNLREPP